MLMWMQKISLKSKVTMLFVSHQIDESIFLGDRVILLSPRPTRVMQDITISLNKPRELSIMGGESFREKKEYILSKFLLMLEDNFKV